MAEVAWESTTVGYERYVTDERYQKFSDAVKRWYKPYRCSHCSELEKALGSAYIAGFKASGEGWNGEYGPSDPETDAYVLQRRDEYLRSLIQKQKEG